MDDPYLWLEDLDDPRTREFIEKHNNRFREYVGDLPGLFFDTILEYYGARTITFFKACCNGVFAIFREKGHYSIGFIDWGGKVENIVSGDELGEHAVIAALYPSRDCRRLGFFYTIAGSDEGVLRIIDPWGKSVLDEIKGSVGNIVWLSDSTYYYTRFYREGVTPDNVEAPAERVFLRELGNGEEMVFGRGLPTNYMIGIEETYEEDRVFIVVQYGWSRSSIYGGLKHDPSTWKPIYEGNSLAEPVGYCNGVPYIIVYDGEGYGRIIRVRDSIVEEVVGENGFPLRKAVLVNQRIYVEYLVNASSRIKIYDSGGKEIDEITFNEPSTVNIIDFIYDKVLVGVTSFSKPTSILILQNTEPTTLYTSGKTLDLFVSEDWCRSSDGTPIHVFIVRARDRGSNGVTIVYGYGGFGLSITPFYVGVLKPFLDDGGTFVVANLRGGREFGEKWHKMGMRENKQNVFEDFKAVLKMIKEKGYRVAGWGSSNGGLLVAATLTQSPDLMDVALIGYPVIDMLRFHKLYIGKLWTTEYGDPDNPRDREYLLKYSPYHNVRHGVKYPFTLVYTGLHDNRVHPGHAFKFVAKLEDAGAPVYLRVETTSGHMGSSPEVKAREFSDILAFLYKTLGLRRQ